MSIVDIAGIFLGAATSATSILVIIYIFVRERITYHETETGYPINNLEKMGSFLFIAISIGILGVILLIIAIILGSSIRFTLKNASAVASLTVIGGIAVICESFILGAGIYYTWLRDND
ncbi:MAG: hypothetical protein ABEI86_06730 [Halobacteriaceae archaeon]